MESYIMRTGKVLAAAFALSTGQGVRLTAAKAGVEIKLKKQRVGMKRLRMRPS